MSWTSHSVGSWSFEQGPTKSEVAVGTPRAFPGHEAAEALGTSPGYEDSEVEGFPPRDFESKLHEAELEWVLIWYQVPLELELEVSLPIYRVCNPCPSWIALYEECCQARLRLSFSIFMELLKFGVISMHRCIEFVGVHMQLS